MSMNKSPLGNRRQFLLGAGAASVAAAAVVATVKPAAVIPPGGKVKATSGRGYELTEHVRNYYRTTAV
jgi:hypothetical protein